MLSRKTLGIAGAAIMGTLVGTNTAHAEILLEGKKTEGGVVYAEESLTTSITGEDGTKYYVVKDGKDKDNLTVKVPIGIATGKDTERDIVVTYTLKGMVFTDESNPTLSDIAGKTPAKLTGGMSGDSKVQFSISEVETKTSDDPDNLVLRIRQLAVDKDAVGSIEVESYFKFGDITVSKKHILHNAVKTQKAIDDSAGAMPNHLTVSVDKDFMKFVPDGETGELIRNVGRFSAGVVAKGLLHAATSSELVTLNNITGAGIGEVTIGGGAFAFAEDIFLSSAENCTGSADSDSVLKRDKDGNVESFVDKVLSTMPMMDKYLCIKVDGKKVIPRTGPYTVTTSYKAMDGAAFPPQGAKLTLGKITHDGTTYQLPFMSVYKAHNQRLMIVNRHSKEVGYSFNFNPEAGVDVEGGAMAEGKLEAGTTKVLKVNGDVIKSITKGTRTAATLTVAAPTGTIDLSSVLVDRPSQTSDSVVYQEK